MRCNSFLFIFIISLLCYWPLTAHAQQATGWYNTDSLLTRISKNKRVKQYLKEAATIYTQAHIDSADVSLQSFKVAYLEKKMLDSKVVYLKGQELYKKKHILTVIDFTKLSNAERFITVDLRRHKILHQALVSQGSGTGDKRNDKYCQPVYFSNEMNSLCSSLGLMVATKGTHPDNPCHLCRFSLSYPHDCVVMLEGLEKGINDNMPERDVVIHTTGSLNFGSGSLRQKLGIQDSLYRIVPESCECCTSAGNGIRGTSSYASACGIAENGGFIGQSNGCPVLPEEDHIGIMDAVKNGSLIFIYSNVISDGTNYLKNSPLMRRMLPKR